MMGRNKHLKLNLNVVIMNISLNAMNCCKIETRVYILEELDFNIRFLVSFMAGIPVQITLNGFGF
jgi:hypothetical protein